MVASTPDQQFSKVGPEPIAGPVLYLGFWCGLVVGLAESAWLAGIRLVAPQFRWTGIDFYWMAPAAEGLVFGFAGLCMVMVLRLFWRRHVWSATLTLVLFLSALTILLSIRRIHPIASTLLSAGIAIREDDDPPAVPPVSGSDVPVPPVPRPGRRHSRSRRAGSRLVAGAARD